MKEHGVCLREKWHGEVVRRSWDRPPSEHARFVKSTADCLPTESQTGC
jgi:hypothetical protein